MTLIKYRSALLGLALAVLLVSALAATGPPVAAAALPAANSSCAVPVFFGLHGMGEGPSLTPPYNVYKNFSPELIDLDNAQNLISGAVLSYFVYYPVVQPSGWDVEDLFNAGPLTAAVQTGVSHLQSDLMSYASGCKVSQLKIALVGYSMGAWVINKWLQEYTSEWDMIKVVVLFGDPCWIDGSDQGLARIFDPEGCMSASYYPKPAATTPFWPDSLCRYHDPVCGGGFNYALSDGSVGIDQLYIAAHCKQQNCPHLHYTDGAPSSGDIMTGAMFMVKHLGLPIR